MSKNLFCKKNFERKNFQLINFEKFKKTEGPTENRTRIIGFKVQCANHYTIGPIDNSHFIPKFVLFGQLSVASLMNFKLNDLLKVQKNEFSDE